MPPRTATPPRGPRHSSPSTRGRGGIQKQRTPFVRTDKDGDAVMGSVGGQDMRNVRGGGRGSARGGFGSSLGTQQGQQAILRGLDTQGVNIIESRIGRGRAREGVQAVQLRILGLDDSKAASNADGGLKNLLGFLERKANGMEPKSRETIMIKKSAKEGKYVIITVDSDASTKILRMNGFTFAGANLTIEIAPAQIPVQSLKDGAEMSSDAKNTEDRIKAILSTRYDPELRLLNLSALGEDIGLRDMGMFDAKNRITKLFPVLMAVCDRLFKTPQEKQEAIMSITLADNGIDTVSTVTSLVHTFPDLLNLDLSRNALTSLRALDPWRWKLRKLQNLILIDNPIESASTSTDYKDEIIRWFPSLQMLNGVQIRTPEQAAMTAEAEIKIQEAAQTSPIPVSGPDFRDVNQIGEGFLKQFFALYDNDRISLANIFYDVQSTVSLSVNVSAPRSKELSLPTHSWAPYIKHSRNLVKVTNIGPRMSRIYRGLESIKSLWAELPKTKHPDLATQISKYIIDCHPIPGLLDQNGQSQHGVDGLMLMIHGEFEEQTDPGKSAVRSFSRSFILGPGAQGGPSIRVVSDMMTLRAFSALTSVVQEPSNSNQVGSSAEDLRRKDIIEQLMLQTQMTPEFASLCLDGTEWDLEKALLAFYEKKAALPPDAFMTSASTL